MQETLGASSHLLALPFPCPREGVATQRDAAQTLPSTSLTTEQAWRSAVTVISRSPILDVEAASRQGYPTHGRRVYNPGRHPGYCRGAS